MLITGLLFLLILGLLVFVHEFGHFWAAKRSGVTVHEFAFGFKPRLVSWKRGETEYAINLLPFGGYVRLEGESEDTGAKGSYASKSAGAKAIILVAGVAMNLVLAWLLLTLAYAIGSSPLSPTFGDAPFAQIHSEVRVLQPAEGSPAQVAGLVAADRIVTLDGQPVTTATDFIVKAKERAGQQITVTLERDGQTKEVQLTPRRDPPKGEGALGLSLVEASTVRSPWYLAPISGLVEVWSEIKLTALGLGAFVKELFITQRVSEDVSGLVGVGVATGIVRHLGIGSVLQFIALISTNLALINLVPIAPLDGGHLLFVGLERLIRRPLDLYKQWVTLAGFGLLLIFGVVVTYKDVIRFDLIGRVQNLF